MCVPGRALRNRWLSKSFRFLRHLPDMWQFAASVHGRFASGRKYQRCIQCAAGRADQVNRRQTPLPQPFLADNLVYGLRGTQPEQVWESTMATGSTTSWRWHVILWTEEYTNQSCWFLRPKHSWSSLLQCPHPWTCTARAGCRSQHLIECSWDRLSHTVIQSLSTLSVKQLGISRAALFMSCSACEKGNLAIPSSIGYMSTWQLRNRINPARIAATLCHQAHNPDTRPWLDSRTLWGFSEI